MFYLSHVLLGILIAKRFPNIFLIIILTLISHFLIDMIPHWDGWNNKKNQKITKKIIITTAFDVIITINVFMIFFLESLNILIIAGVLFSLIPDMITGISNLTDNKTIGKFTAWHRSIQGKASWKIGLLIQVIIAVLIFLLILI